MDKGELPDLLKPAPVFASKFVEHFLQLLLDALSNPVQFALRMLSQLAGFMSEDPILYGTGQGRAGKQAYGPKDGQP